MTPAEERKPFTKKDYPNSTAAEMRKSNEEQARTPVFADITREACAFLEAARNVRYFEQALRPGEAIGPGVWRFRHRRVCHRPPL
jgi:hypothetical protein